MVKIISWNVNGIRSVIKKEEFQKCLKDNDPDIICIQETKAQEWQVKFPEWICELYPYRYWNDADKKGYSGVLTMSKTKPLDTMKGFHIECNSIDCDYSNSEGRVISTLWPWGWLVNVYTPNSKMDLSRLNYRTQQWDKGFINHCNLLKGVDRSVVICGDLNVAHKSIDVWSPKCSGPGLTKEERESFENIFLKKEDDEEYIDSYRRFNPERKQYTWWSNLGRSREFNKGWRLDYFMVSRDFIDGVESSNILDQQWGSDHCPIELNFNH